MPSSDVLENVPAATLIVPDAPETISTEIVAVKPARLRVAVSNHIKLIAFLVAVYALIFNKAMHDGKVPRLSPIVKTQPSSDQNILTVSYIR